MKGKKNCVLKWMKEKLPSIKFVRLHPSFIISIDKIESFKKSMVKIGEKKIPVSDMFRDNFFNMIGWSI